jgi:hypothetical protein
MFDEKLAKRRLKRLITLTKYEALYRRKLDFSLTFDNLWSLLVKQNYQCALTGWTLEYTSGGNFDRRNPVGCTIDRIDNSKGYVQDNVQLVCCIVNITRSKLEINQFVDLCQAVARTADLTKNSQFAIINT